jgi:hypothetical protein
VIKHDLFEDLNDQELRNDPLLAVLVAKSHPGEEATATVHGRLILIFGRRNARSEGEKHLDPLQFPLHNENERI